MLLFAISACSGHPEAERTSSAQQLLSATASRTLGFESTSDWTPIWSQPTLKLSSIHSEGTASLSIQGGGWMSVVSRKLTRADLSEPPPSIVGFDIRIPQNPVNPWWYGTTELYVDAPSVGLWGVWLGTRELIHFQRGQFERAEFSLPAWVQSRLAGQFADLRFRIVINTSGNETAPHFVDRFTYGPAPVDCLPQNDGNPCTLDGCDSGVPTWTPLAPDTPCDTNGTVCDGSGVCNATGSCVLGPAPEQDDGNPCTADGCDSSGGVFHVSAEGCESSPDWRAEVQVGSQGGSFEAAGVILEIPPDAIGSGVPDTFEFVVFKQDGLPRVMVTPHVLFERPVRVRFLHSFWFSEQPAIAVRFEDESLSAHSIDEVMTDGNDSWFDTFGFSTIGVFIQLADWNGVWPVGKPSRITWSKKSGMYEQGAEKSHPNPELCTKGDDVTDRYCGHVADCNDIRSHLVALSVGSSGIFQGKDSTTLALKQPSGPPLVLTSRCTQAPRADGEDLLTSPELRDALTLLSLRWSASHGSSYGLWLNGGYDSTGQIHEIGSRHYSGRAVDIGLCQLENTPSPRRCNKIHHGHPQFATLLGQLADSAMHALQDYAASALANDIKVFVYNEPDENGQANHVHVSYTYRCPAPWTMERTTQDGCRRPKLKVEIGGEAAPAGSVDAISQAQVQALSCGSSTGSRICEKEFDGGVDLSLGAVSAPGSGAEFAGWQGPDCPVVTDSLIALSTDARHDIDCRAIFECADGHVWSAASQRCEVIESDVLLSGPPAFAEVAIEVDATGLPAVAYYHLDENRPNPHSIINSFELIVHRGDVVAQTAVVGVNGAGARPQIAFSPRGMGAVLSKTINDDASTIFIGAAAQGTVAQLVRAGTPEIHDLTYGNDGQPRVVYFSFPSSVQIDTVDVRFSRWDGSDWVTTLIEPSELTPHQSNLATAHDSLTDDTVATYTAWRYESALDFVLARIPLQGAAQITSIEAGDARGIEGMVGTFSDVVVDEAGQPHVAYVNEHFERFFTGEIRYFGPGGVRESIEDNVDVRRSVAITVAPDGSPIVAYIRFDGSGVPELRLVQRRAGGWSSLPALTTSSSVSSADIEVANGVLYATYRDDTGVHLASRGLQ